MLDSTGPSRRQKVPCFLCKKNDLEFQVYTPECGHAGEKLDIGSCMAPHFDPAREEKFLKNSTGGKFLEIKAYNAETDPQVNHYDSTVTYVEFGLRLASSPYHYNGFELPNFGDSINSVIYL